MTTTNITNLLGRIKSTGIEYHMRIAQKLSQRHWWLEVEMESRVVTF